MRGTAAVRWRAATAYWLVVYRRLWRATLTASIIEPVAFLAAMGYGLGSYVHGGSNDVDGVRYIVFLAPGLLASGALQTAMSQASWPVMGAVRWEKTYFAQQATPLSAADIAVGHQVAIAIRVLINAAIFVVVMAVFGVVDAPGGTVLALPAAVLTGTAFGLLVAAFAVRQDKDSNLALLYRLGLIPLFLFSGTFFPVSQLPEAIRWLAWVTPLWHGVSLCRDLALGTGAAAAELGHVAYLLATSAAGSWLIIRSYQKRLVT